MTRIRHLTQASIVALVALAMAAPVAQAMLMPRSGDGPTASTAQPVSPYAGHGSRGIRPERFQATSPAPVYGAGLADRYGVWRPPASVGAVATPQSDNEFNWGAAAIGAAVVALVLGVLGVTVTRVRTRRFAH